ncbi:MAG TPA: outer membrane beta-barrel protein [Polyangia bacterium]|jgi:opacity protein-like surface antigen
MVRRLVPLVLILSITELAAAQEPLASAPASAPAAPAADVTATAPAPAGPHGTGLVVDLSVGALVPTSKYDTGFLGGLRLGYRLPWLAQRLGVAVGLAYLRTGRTVSGTDPRVPDGTWSADVPTDQLVIDLEIFWRFFDASHRLVPYVGAGPALFLLRDTPKTYGAENTEDSTQVGFVVQGGADYRLGPGAVFGEVRAQYAGVNRTVPGDHNLGGIGLQVGYRVFF